MGTKNEKDEAKTLGLRSHSLIRLRGRGTVSAVGGAFFAHFIKFDHFYDCLSPFNL